MKFKDYYATLGVARTATADEIRLAYRKAARKYHPDVSKEKNAEERFKEVQEAYEVLKDSDKRASYDQLGSNYRAGQQFRAPPGWEGRGGGAGGAGFTDLNGFSDFFASMFGGAAAGGFGGAPRGRQQPEAEQEIGEIEVSLEDVHRGAKRRLALQSEGRERIVELQVPAGVADGQALRIAGEGSRPAVRVRVRYLAHPFYTVAGRDVSIELPVSPWEAALGTKVEMPTLAGPVELRVPAGAQSGQKLRLRGRGLPGSPAGDQLVILRIVIPPAESPEARAAYERMRDEFAFEPRADWP